MMIANATVVGPPEALCTLTHLNAGDWLMIAIVGAAAMAALIVVGHIMKWWTFTLGRKNR